MFNVDYYYTLYHLIQIVNKSLDIPEFQGEIEQIARLKCMSAVEKEPGRELLVEDTALCFNALGGMPGPYIKWFLDKIGPEGLYRLLTDWEDKTAQAICTIGYWDGHEVHLFQGIIEGTIVPPRGPEGAYGFDYVLQPNGYDRTLAELGLEIKNKISHRAQAVVKLRDYILQREAVNK